MTYREQLAKEIRNALGQHDNPELPVVELVRRLRARIAELEAQLERERLAKGNELTEQSEKQQAIPSLVELDLRDFFAASATEEDIAAIMKQHIRSGFGAAHAGYSITRGQARYLHADAMLKAREVGHG